MEITHAIRQYNIPASQPNAITDPLQGRMLLFIGEMAHGQLPIIACEPVTGLPNYFLMQATGVPNDDIIDSFYQTHPTDELVPAQSTGANSSQQQTRSLTFIPLPWIPACIEDLPPKEALDRAREIIGIMLAASRNQFDFVLHYLKAACQKSTGIVGTCKMLVPVTRPGRSPYFQHWCLQQLRTYYPTACGKLTAETKDSTTLSSPPAQTLSTAQSWWALLPDTIQASLAAATK
jgi:hypothetical protein